MKRTNFLKGSPESCWVMLSTLGTGPALFNGCRELPSVSTTFFK